MRIKNIQWYGRKIILINLFIIAAILFLFHRPSYGDRETYDKYLNELFGPVDLVKHGNVLPPQYSQLTTTDKKNLIDAKTVLIFFLKSFNLKDQNPLDYLLPSLAIKYEDRYELYQKEFGAETLLKIEIYNFLIKGVQKEEIIFYTTLVDTTEGEDRIWQTAFAVKKVNDTWKISRFGEDIQYWEKELRIKNKES